MHRKCIATYASSRGGSSMSWILAKKCHNLLFRKIRHELPDLLEEIYGRDVFRSWDCPASPILPTQIDHDHALMIPELWHTKGC